MEAQLNKMRVVDLRKELEKYGLSKSGLKADLVARLLEHHSNNNESHSEENDSNDENENPNIARKTVQRKAQSAKRVAKRVEDSESESEEEVNPKKQKKSIVETSVRSQLKQTEDTKQTTVQEKEHEEGMEESSSSQEEEGIPAKTTKPTSQKTHVSPSVASQVLAKPKLNLHQFINNNKINNALTTVSQQIHPQFELTSTSVGWLRHRLLFVVERILTPLATQQNQPQTISIAQLNESVAKMLGTNLSTYAARESSKAVERYLHASQGSIQSEEELGILTELTFPVTLFDDVIAKGFQLKVENGFGVTLVAVMEYLTAEILEVAGNYAEESLKTSVTVQDLYNGVQRDTDLSQVLADYKPYCIKPEEQHTVNHFESKVNELFGFITNAPAEELPVLLQHMQNRIKIIDGTEAIRIVLERFTQQLEEDVAAQVRRLSDLITVQDVSCTQLCLFEQFIRTKITVFDITSPSGGSIFTFYYKSDMPNVAEEQSVSTLMVSEKRINDSSEESTIPPNTVLWVLNDQPQDMRLELRVLEEIKEILGASVMDNKIFASFLLSVCEAESGGSIGKYAHEMNKMEEGDLFQ